MKAIPFFDDNIRIDSLFIGLVQRNVFPGPLMSTYEEIEISVGLSTLLLTS